MSNLLYVFERDMPTVSITKSMWQNLSEKYLVDTRFCKLIDVRKTDLEWADILIMIRPNNNFAWRIAQKAQSSGRFVITMCDDDLLHLPQTHPDLPWQRNGFVRALEQSNALMTCSRFLMRELVEKTKDKRGIFIDTVVKEDELFVRNYEEEDDSTVKIVYAAGGGQHEHLFEQIVLPALQKIVRKTTHQISITFISVHPKCESIENHIEVNYVPGMPLNKYREFMKVHCFDIGISPLDNNRFTRCKYFNKYLEYTLSGVVGVYSNVEPYTYIINDGVNGFLADNTDETWFSVLTEAIENTKKRREYARNAQEHVRSCFNEKVIMERIFKDAPELQKYMKEKEACRSFYHWKIIYILSSIVEYVYKSFFYLKKEGMHSIISKLRNRLKKQAT